jgi:molecular chaperone GrpE
MDQELLRVRADAENYRKRMAREKEQHCKFAAQEILEDLMPILDNLELAVGHGRKVEACSDLVQGVDMTIQLFLDTLKKHGLEPIECSEGEEFDPNWHEALAEEERNDLEAGRVCQIVQKGYRYKDRVLRPAKVMVSKNC